MESLPASHNLRRTIIAMLGTLAGLASAAWLTVPHLPIG